MGFWRWPTNPRTVREYERERLLERIDREGATVGATIPEKIEVAGDPFPLKEFIFEVKRLESVPPEKQEEVDEAKILLRRERRDRRETLEVGEVPVERGEELAEAVIGIDRALNALESLGSTDLAAEAQAKKAADTKRWYSFLEDVLGKDDDSRKRRGVR